MNRSIRITGFFLLIAVGYTLLFVLFPTVDPTGESPLFLRNSIRGFMVLLPFIILLQYGINLLAAWRTPTSAAGVVPITYPTIDAALVTAYNTLGRTIILPIVVLGLILALHYMCGWTCVEPYEGFAGGGPCVGCP